MWIEAMLTEEVALFFCFLRTLSLTFISCHFSVVLNGKVGSVHYSLKCLSQDETAEVTEEAAKLIDSYNSTISFERSCVFIAIL